MAPSRTYMKEASMAIPSLVALISALELTTQGVRMENSTGKPISVVVDMWKQFMSAFWKLKDLPSAKPSVTSLRPSETQQHRQVSGLVGWGFYVKSLK